jgi:hypothetical protein
MSERDRDRIWFRRPPPDRRMTDRDVLALTIATAAICGVLIGLVLYVGIG